MSDDLIFREVDEDVRRERMEAVWKRYGIFAIAGALLIVAIVAGSVFWKDYQKSEREGQGGQFEAAGSLSLQENHAAAASAFEALANEGNEGYRLLAALRAAEERAAAGATAEALAAYDRMIDAGTGSDRMQDIIRLKAALLALESEGGDAAIARLGDLAGSGSPFSNAAREVHASALLSNNDRDGAIAQLKAIAEDQSATPAQRDRVSRFLLALGG